jgi:hypothetical protein
MDIQSDRRPASPSGMHAVLKSIMQRGWKADPAMQPTMAEICRELSEAARVRWSRRRAGEARDGGAVAERVEGDAAGLFVGDSGACVGCLGAIAETQARLAKTQARLQTRA